MIAFLLFFLALFSVAKPDEVSCTQAFCDNYITKNKCAALPANCLIQNSTNNGLFLPFAGPCNCCEYCLENLKEYDDCSIGSVSSPVPSSICGDGLFCNAVTKKCGVMESACTQEQHIYDEKRRKGTLGHLEVRPICEADGKYKPYVCVPGEICYCVDEQGNRIFGEIPFNSMAEFIMHCECSRYNRAAAEALGKDLYPHERFRCTPKGDFDPLQCIGDKCFCVDEQDGIPTYPDEPSVNMSQISVVTLPCFNAEIHKTSYYYQDCENQVITELDKIKQMQDEGYEVLGVTLPNCQLDGKYGLVQSNDTHKYCASPEDVVLEEFILEKSSELSVSMDCQCAKTRSVMTMKEKPSCLQNGNYNPVQCRRGKCRCVDGNGKQTGKEVDYEDRDSVPCYVDTSGT